MNDALGQEIKIGDYVSYANRYGMLLIRVSRLEEYEHRGMRKVRMVGRYAIKIRDGWSLMYNGWNRPFEHANAAIVIDRSKISDELVKLLTE